MDGFCIDACLLGTEKHLVSTVEGYQWLRRVPQNLWHFDGNLKEDNDVCFDSLLKLSQVSVVTSPSSRFSDPIAFLAQDVAHPPWQKLMPSWAHKAFMKGIVENVSVALPLLDVGYFEGTWVPGNAVIRKMRRAKVDAQVLKDLIASGEGNVPALKSFKPREDGFAGATAYDRFGTVTGRLTVVSGPQLHTLKREHRRILVSRYGSEGSIVSLDYKALEPHVLLHEAGTTCDRDDLYSEIATETQQTREVTKLAVISVLYGAGVGVLQANSGMSSEDAHAVITKVKRFFKPELLLAKIKDEFLKTGFIRNRYGRKIVVDEPLDHVMLNHYVQSSGADVAMLGFKQMLDTLEENVPDAVPLFLHHDAVVLDVRNKDMDNVGDLCNGVIVPGYTQVFPVNLGLYNKPTAV